MKKFIIKICCKQLLKYNKQYVTTCDKYYYTHSTSFRVVLFKMILNICLLHEKMIMKYLEEDKVILEDAVYNKDGNVLYDGEKINISYISYKYT